MSALPHLPNFLTALFSGCLLSYAPLEVLGTPPPSFRVSRGYFLLSSILIFTYLLWHPRVPSSSHPVSLSFLFVLLRVRCLYSFPSFSPGCFLTFYLLLPERCFFSHSLRPPHNTSCFYSFGCDFPYSEPSQAPFPLFQSILPWPCSHLYFRMSESIRRRASVVVAASSCVSPGELCISGPSHLLLLVFLLK